MKKQEIVVRIRNLTAIDAVRRNKKVYEQLINLQQAIKKDFYSVVVLGEFKRGKSTFVNSLLGDSLLPMAVLPETATINMIIYNEDPCLRVIYKDDREEDGTPDAQYLKRFSALVENSCANEVKFIKIGYPIDLLRNRIMLIDTPGVADLDETRCDVTYGIVPFANAVIFILDANTPFTKTEKDFIEERLIPMGVDNILFIVNKYDLVDEEEDEDFLDDLECRIRKELNINTDNENLKYYKLLPLSASMALKGMQNNDNSMIQESGINAVKEELMSMLDKGKIEKNKLRWYENKLTGINHILLSDLESEINLKLSDEEELQKTLRELNHLIDEKEQKQKSIEEYCKKSKEMFYAMADKSLILFSNNLKEDVFAAIDEYNGDDFKDFIEKRISRQMQKSIESWVGTYSPQINILTSSLERELSIGIGYYFNQKINLKSNKGELKKSKILFNVEAMDVSDVGFQAGAIAAASSVGLLTLVGSTIMPLVSFAALPFLKNYMLKNKLSEAKAEVIPSIESSLAKAFLGLQHEIHNFIELQVQKVQGNAIHAYSVMLTDFKNRITEELHEKKEAGNNIQQDIIELRETIKNIKEIMS